ncbi:Iron-sulfur cluster biosynthesis protein IscS [Spironucleus salmonicida]|uniref:cysteine desulfurase n=1 Tax=Spironucleus salmonicida TaxID=348837 RepID=K7RUI6_9EUKA|nr:cysteine desulfurase [Spironucleus salmonicida]KAH0572565.1 Iron-sulfur cluster biosynthesis protein IscS [Spironucleus salmonicida]|eukprot:EST44485.1 Cysteine desulfurase [Spironucleus salmonicida]
MIYLDNQATTPIDPRVLEKIVPYLTENFANCHSQHQLGRQMNSAVDVARQQVASLIGAKPSEIIFTSGATESNNIAVKGAARYAQKKHVITSTIEHKCVLESVRALEAEGYQTHFINVDDKGLIKMDEFKEACDRFKNDIGVVSIMAANNEMGSIQDIQELGKISKRAGAVFHTDCAQAAGKIALNTENIDLMSISGHKIYGPKGVGALYVKRRTRLNPLFSGGGQEQNIRPGTLPVFLVVGLGEAAEISQKQLVSDHKHYESLYNYASDKINKLEHVKFNGPDDKTKRLLNCMNVSFLGVEGESLMMAIDDDVCVSTGSACTSQSLEPSHVLHAMDIPAEAAHTSVRMGFSRWTTKKDVDEGLDKIISEVNRLRDISIVWDLMKQGKNLNDVGAFGSH